MQKVEKIEPNKSSDVKAPVISDRALCGRPEVVGDEVNCFNLDVSDFWLGL